MVKLPDDTVMGGLPSPSSGRPIAQYDTRSVGAGAAGIARGLNQARQSVDNWSDERDKYDVAQADAEFLIGRQRLLSQMEKETDPNNLAERYGEHFKKLAENSAALINNPRARQMWSTGRSPVVTQDTIAAQDRKFSLVADNEVASANERLDGLREAALEAGSEEERAANVQAANNLLDSLVSRGYVSQVQAQEQRQNWTRSYASARIETMDPEKRVDVLKSNAGVAEVLPEEDRVALLGKAYEERELGRISRNPEYARYLDGASVGVKSLIREKEGFQKSAYWDVNAYRAGYGSDTYTTADGKVHKVTKDSVVTKEDAERDLNRRIKEFHSTAIGNVGEAAWNALPENAQNALVSLAYNYGEIPARIRSAVKSGDLDAIADAVEGLASDNKGVNANRRMSEAAIIRAAGVSGADIPEASMARIRTAAQTQNRAARGARKEQIDLGILEGSITDESQILNDPLLDNGDKTTLVRSLRTETTRRENETVVQSILSDGGTLNIYDEKQRKGLDSVYKSILKVVPAEQQGAAAIELIEKTGYVPDSLIRDVRSGLVSQDDATLLNSIGMADKALKVNPSAFAGRDGDAGVGKAVEFFRSHRTLGYPDEHIVQLYRDSNNVELRGKREALLGDKTVKKWLTEKTTPDDVLDVFDAGIFDFQPEFANDAQASAVSGEYRSLVEDALVETGGNQDAAIELAKARIAKVYGQSELNLSGREILMRHPPEKYYPQVGGGHAYVREQLSELVKSVEGLDAEEVYLQADETTETDIKAGRMPRYQVWYVDNLGRPQVLLNGHFIPDVEDASKKQSKKKLSPRELNEINRNLQRNPIDYSDEAA